MSLAETIVKDTYQPSEAALELAIPLEVTGVEAQHAKILTCQARITPTIGYPKAFILLYDTTPDGGVSCHLPISKLVVYEHKLVQYPETGLQ